MEESKDNAANALECVVCTLKFPENQLYHNKFCAVEHLICKNCIYKCLEKKYECPYCREFMTKESIFIGVQKEKINQEKLKELLKVFKENVENYKLSEKMEKRKSLLRTCLTECRSVISLLKDLKFWKSMKIGGNVAGMAVGTVTVAHLSGKIPILSEILSNLSGITAVLSAFIWVATQFALNHFENKKADEINQQIKKLKGILEKVEGLVLEDAQVQRFVSVILQMREIFYEDETLLKIEDFKFQSKFKEHLQQVSIIQSIEYALNSISQYIVYISIASGIAISSSWVVNGVANTKLVESLLAENQMFCEKLSVGCVKLCKFHYDRTFLKKIDEKLLGCYLENFLNKALDEGQKSLDAATFNFQKASQYATTMKVLGYTLSITNIVLEGWALYKNADDVKKISSLIKMIEEHLSSLEGVFQGI